MTVKRPNVRWDEFMWDDLADRVWAMLPNSLDKSLVHLSQQAVLQLPASQRRKLTTLKDVEKITLRIKAKIRAAKEALEEVGRLKMALETRQTAEDLLQEISDEELLRVYGGRLLSLLSADTVASHFPAAELLAAIRTPSLVGLAVERFMESLETESANPIDSFRKYDPRYHDYEQPPKEANGNILSGSRPVRINKPVVGVLGLLPQQLRDLQAKCPKALLTIIEPGHCPKHAALYVAWTNFINHTQQLELRNQVPSDRFTLCSGGLTTLAKMINRRLETAKA